MTQPALNPQAPEGRKEVRAALFACRWCALLGAGRAGLDRIHLPASFRVIPVECAASVEPDLVLRALADGIDGVAVLGCHLGGCRHNEANRPARLRLTLLQDLLEIVGLDRRRLLLSWGTAHEGHQFGGLVREFMTELEAMPPVDTKLLRPF
ncbi:MAG: hydrogenase iron-sulfur subunit [Desulfobacteraceae bacterium]|nr:hydrogenase iron-sulfur subunit [Desulfobacteraceae bacterium]